LYLELGSNETEKTSWFKAENEVDIGEKVVSRKSWEKERVFIES